MSDSVALNSVRIHKGPPGPEGPPGKDCPNCTINSNIRLLTDSSVVSPSDKYIVVLGKKEVIVTLPLLIDIPSGSDKAPAREINVKNAGLYLCRVRAAQSDKIEQKVELIIAKGGAKVRLVPLGKTWYVF